MKLKNIEPVLNRNAELSFLNTGKCTFQKLKEERNNVAANLQNFINGSSANGRVIIEYFNLGDHITRLDEANLLFMVVNRFAAMDLHPQTKTMPAYLDSGKCCKNRGGFDADLNAAIMRSGIKISAPLKNAIMKALSEGDETADIRTDGKGNPEPDTGLRDYENVPLKEDISEYFEREVRPQVPDAWIDESKTAKGYEISFIRYFYKYKPLSSLAEIRAGIPALEEETEGMIREVLNG